jgi:cytoskeletal protein CcmA (bactofilin family)
MRFSNGSKISGNIAAKKLRIEDGVDFSGQVTMLDVEEETPDIFSMSVSEYKQALMPEAFLETEKGMEN